MFAPSSNPRGTKRAHGLRRAVAATPLDAEEQRNAQQVWAMQLGARTSVEHLATLFQLLDRLQVPMQPVIKDTVEASFRDAEPNFGFASFVNVLEQCKTLHGRWLHKIRGKKIDDDVLEAFVAVGGESDSSGMVNLTALQKTLADFNLSLPDLAPQAAPSSPTREGTSNMEFNGFMDLLRTDKAAQTELSSHLFLRDRDLDEEEPEIQTNGSRSNSRRQSLRASMRHHLPSISHHHSAAPTPQQQQLSQPKRSVTSMEDRIATQSPLRHTSSKATGVSRLPQINRMKREKKFKFANW